MVFLVALFVCVDERDLRFLGAWKCFHLSVWSEHACVYFGSFREFVRACVRGIWVRREVNSLLVT